VLPDFPKSRKQLSEMLSLRLHLRAQAKSPLSAIGQQFTQHEAKTFSYEQITDAGKVIVEEGYKEIRIPITTRYEEVPELVGDALLQRIDAIADEIARQAAQHMYRKLDESTRQAGTAVDAGGGPLTQELFLHTEELREMDFDPKTGNPEGVYLVHPDTAEHMSKLWQEWEQDKLFMKRVREQRARKYEGWRDRESHRKLVD
jgi:hypothetical protein